MEWGLPSFSGPSSATYHGSGVLSGPGLIHLYQYLASAGFAPAQKTVQDEMRREDPAAVVTRHALAGSDALCVKALDMFASIYGAQAGHLALTVVATGGIYLAGGIAPRIITRLQAGGFMKSFRALGRFEEFASKVPVHVIINPDVGPARRGRGGVFLERVTPRRLPSRRSSRSRASAATGSRSPGSRRGPPASSAR